MADNLHPDAPHLRPAPYDAWLQWSVPAICNLHCAYCRDIPPESGTRDTAASAQRGSVGTLFRAWGLLSKSMRLGIRPSLTMYRVRRSTRPGTMPAIDTSALVKTLDRTGKIFRIGISGGGEPFLIPNIIDACVELGKKHFLAFNSNLTLPRCLEVARLIDPARVVHFHASLHLSELERLGLVDRFITHYMEFKNRGFPIFAEAVGHPSLVPQAQRFVERFEKAGVTISFGPFHGDCGGKHYPQAYTAAELAALGLDKNETAGFYSLFGTLCNAGYNAAVVAGDGTVRYCWDVAGRLGHLYGRIRFNPAMMTCPANECSCPLPKYDRYLWSRAIAETKQER
jgi:organic radical activating enzyme